MKREEYIPGTIVKNNNENINWFYIVSNDAIGFNSVSKLIYVSYTNELYFFRRVYTIENIEDFIVTNIFI